MKDQSDIFICKLKRGGYWAYPSPFVAHGGGFEVQFRNLTDDAIEIDFSGTPVHKETLSLEPRAADYVIVNGDAVPGLFEYVAEVKPVTRRVRRAVFARAGRKAETPKRPKRIFVRGGSPPRIIVDT